MMGHKISLKKFKTEIISSIFSNYNGKKLEISNIQFSSVQSLSCVWLFATPGMVTCQAPLSMRFPRQEYWKGLPFPLPGDLPNPGIEPKSPTILALQTDSLPLNQLGSPMSQQYILNKVSLNINTHKTRLCTYKLRKFYDQRLTGA